MSAPTGPPPAAPGPPRMAPPPSPARSRVNGWLVAFAVTSVVLLGVGIAVLLLGKSSQSDAESDRDTKQEQLASQRKSSAATEQEAEQRRQQANDVAAASDNVLNLSVQGVQNDQQIVSASQDAVNTFENPDPTAFNAAVDRRVAAVERDNALTAQLNAALDDLRAKVDALGKTTETNSFGPGRSR